MLNLKSLKEKVISNKIVTTAITTALVTIPSFSAYATEGSTGGVGSIDIAGPLTNALNTTITNTLACFSAIIPIGLTIFGAKFAWIKGIQFFSKIASK